MLYTLDEHRHRFAALCATRAASTSKLCRFKASIGAQLIAETELMAIARSWDTMPAPEFFNSVHRRLRHHMVSRAPELLGNDPSTHFTHGVAAKLINVYLKAACVVPMPAEQHPRAASHEDKLNAVHPPIDGALLAALEKRGVGGLGPLWAGLNRIGWSKFNSEQYEHAIRAMHAVTNGALWRIERFRVDRQPEPAVHRRRAPMPAMHTPSWT